MAPRYHVNKLATCSGGERRNKPISKSSLEDLSKGVDGGGYQGLHGEHGCKLGIEAEAAGFVEDVCLDRLVDNMFGMINYIMPMMLIMLALQVSSDGYSRAAVQWDMKLVARVTISSCCVCL